MKYTWLVEKYLEGELQGKELSDFEILILKDPAVAEEVENIRKLNAFCIEQHSKLKSKGALREDFNDPQHISGEDEILNDLDGLRIKKISDTAGYQDMVRKIKKTIREESPDKKQARIFFLVKHSFWLTAASFALILTVSVFLLSRSNRDSDPQVIYRQFYQPYSPELTVRNTESALADDYLSGLDEYRNGYYSKALEYFNASLSVDPGNLSVYLFKGISLMELGDYRQALTVFGQLSGDPILDEYGRWYSGLCFLRLDRPDEARKIFKGLKKQDSYFSSQSRSVLKQL